MANNADAVRAKAAALVRRWTSSSAGRLPPVGQQLLDPAVQLRRQAREDVFQVSPGFVPVELCRLQQAHDDSGPLAGQLTADEEPVAAAKSNHRVILPMSGKRWRSSTAGMHSTVVVFDGNTANSERQVR